MRRRAFLAAGASTCVASACSSERGVPLWFSYGGKNREVLLALVERWNREQPDHRIHPVYQGDYFELLAKLRTALHAGRAPAVTHVVAEVLPYLVEADVLIPLDDLVGSERELGLVPELSQSGTFIASSPRHTYGIPFNRSTPIAYLNGELLDQLRLKAPSTWDELLEFARVASAGDGAARRYGFSCPIDWWFWVAMVAQAGGNIVDETGAFTLGDQQGVEALELWQRLVNQERTMRPPTGRDYSAWGITNREFLSGRAVMIWNSTAFVRYLEENASFPVVAAPLPKRTRAGVPSGGTLFVLPKGSTRKEQDTGARFLRFMSQPEVSNEFATKTGYIPVTSRGIELLEADGYYQRRPNDRVAVEQLSAVQPWPWHTELFRVQREVVQGRLEAAVLAGENASEVLSAARAAIRDPR